MPAASARRARASRRRPRADARLSDNTAHDSTLRRRRRAHAAPKKTTCRRRRKSRTRHDGRCGKIGLGAGLYYKHHYFVTIGYLLFILPFHDAIAHAAARRLVSGAKSAASEWGRRLLDFGCRGLAESSA